MEKPDPIKEEEETETVEQEEEEIEEVEEEKKCISKGKCANEIFPYTTVLGCGMVFMGLAVLLLFNS